VSSPQPPVVVVGGGAAGLFTALRTLEEGGQVTLVTAGPLAHTASYWAQGGLAAAVGADDAVELHLEDTERAGRGAVRRSAAAALVGEAPDRLRELLAMGVSFDCGPDGSLALGLEGGHSRRRIVHAGGSETGRRLLAALAGLLVGRDRLTVVEGRRAVGLLVDGGGCCGVVLDDGRTLAGGAVVLACGGAAALWRRTTNPPGSVGIGLALAWRAGAELADLELIQFHPTAVSGIAGREGFLISEAVRGEGATLIDRGGRRFVDELAPRDVVARAIAELLAAEGEGAALLDMRGVDPGRFPNLFAALREAGLDPARQPVPVAPAAHYTIGGVRTDLHGRTTLPGLYAVGECGCNGLHGANRLASNSLSECFVFGARAARAALGELRPPARRPRSIVAEELELSPPQPLRDALWRDAGIVRSAERLERLLDNRHPLARLIARAALERRESRGVHQRSDHPRTDGALDRHHLCFDGGGNLRWQRWD